MIGFSERSLMTEVRITTPSRLHFGLLGWGPDAPRQFGGVGLMIDRPGLELHATTAEYHTAEGPFAPRILQFAARACERDSTLPHARFQIFDAPPEHVGLGAGTQLGLAVVRALTRLAGHGQVPLERLAELSGRGLRSGIGLHGFERGGLIVDGGRRSNQEIPPLVLRKAFPAGWGVVLVLPQQGEGLHGNDEVHAFTTLPSIPSSVTDRLCRHILLGMIPSIVESDIESFGRSVEAIQAEVGACFAPAQGGIYASARHETMVVAMRDAGLRGVGQSSWGPALYGFFDTSAIAREELALTLRTLPSLVNCQLIFTQAAVDSDHSSL
jgi:beta-ribofuranosylaminobenzene 5'-phosphate synthase